MYFTYRESLWSLFTFALIAWIRCSVGFRNGEYAIIHIIVILCFSRKFLTSSVLWIEQLSQTIQIFAFRLSVYRDFYFNIPLRNNMNLWLVFDSEYPRRPSSLFQLNPTIKLILKLSVLCTFHPFFPLLAQPYLLSVFYCSHWIHQYILCDG